MGLLAVDSALEQLIAWADQAPRLATEWLAATEALGRVLAEPVLAPMCLPPWPNSSMDGYAVRSAEVQAGTRLPISQVIYAGRMPEPLAAGSCARIFTGAPLPEGADAVEMQENVQADGQQAEFTKALPLQQFVRPQGQECQTGQVMLAAGERLTALALGQIASLGVEQVCVYRPLQVALLSTGDELAEPGQALQPGQIYNSNRYLLKPWLERLGCLVQDLGVIPDDLVRTRQQLEQLTNVDLILTTGGVSVGDADFLGKVLREEGELVMWKLALKPGKPFTFGHYRKMPVIGLPGNPTSSAVTFALLTRPYILRRLGVQQVMPQAFYVPVNFSIKQAGNRREFLRARLVNGKAELFSNQCSGVLSSMVWAEGLVVLPEHSVCEVNDLLAFYPLSELLA